VTGRVGHFQTKLKKLWQQRRIAFKKKSSYLQLQTKLREKITHEFSHDLGEKNGGRNPVHCHDSWGGWCGVKGRLGLQDNLSREGAVLSSPHQFYSRRLGNVVVQCKCTYGAIKTQALIPKMGVLGAGRGVCWGGGGGYIGVGAKNRAHCIFRNYCADLYGRSPQ